MQNSSDSQKLAVIEAAVLDMKKQLFGNGQPGQLERLHSRINQVDDRIDGVDDRVDGLENWKWYVIGGGMVAGAVLGYVLR